MSHKRFLLKILRRILTDKMPGQRSQNMQHNTENPCQRHAARLAYALWSQHTSHSRRHNPRFTSHAHVSQPFRKICDIKTGMRRAVRPPRVRLPGRTPQGCLASPGLLLPGVTRFAYCLYHLGALESCGFPAAGCEKGPQEHGTECGCYATPVSHWHL
jgi:hypothetical protein